MDGVVLFRAERKNRTDHSGKLYAFHHIFRVILLSVASHHFRAWVGTRCMFSASSPGNSFQNGPLLETPNRGESRSFFAAGNGEEDQINASD